jgi:branched-chain amino acid transport system permease protein
MSALTPLLNIDRERYLTYLLLIVGAGILLGFPYIATVYKTHLLTEILIYAIFALSLNLLMGYTGLASLGHAAFWGGGGYAIAMMMVKGGFINFFLCLGTALFVSAMLGFVFGFLALRTSGVYFVMITLALGQMLWALAWRWNSFLGGSNGLHGVTRPNFGLPWSLREITHFYYFILVIFAFAVFLIYRITKSPFGRTLVGIRENESRMEALGYHTWRYKYFCFVFAAVFAGLAGALKVYQDGSINPGCIGVAISGMVILMVLTGGARNFYGPIVGAAIVWIIRNIVSSYTAYWGATLGIILVLIVMFSPQGITPLVITPMVKLRQKLWNR